MIGDMLKFRGRGAARAEVTVGVIMAVAVIALWEGVARAGLIAPQFLPAPSRVVTALWQMTVDQSLLWHAWISTLRVWVAFLIAAAMAIPIGILMSSYRIVGAALEPIIDFIRYLPVPALVPLSIIWFGWARPPRSSCSGWAPSFNSCCWWRMTRAACRMNMSRSPSRWARSRVRS